LRRPHTERNLQLKDAITLGQHALPLSLDPEETYSVTYNGMELEGRYVSAEVGFGLYTTRDIPAGRYIVAARGELIPETMTQSADQQRYTYSRAEGAKFHIDLSQMCKANVVRCMNSSRPGRTPNVLCLWVTDYLLVLQSMKQISAGTELLADY
jgi:hypothetical protein